ncbi:uncharacterized protein LOC129769077 [Toxorhynchites rutilus septentrionalis]|uniref:uncharacterized protein LOC129769077 n=1 Tax=Toxorhynchites rutilus septentrionalis TaxID=329112 RepID=UPI00247A016B|nr:uncharacterized protein LOC129769077 [Toxorhynchites rutilus septentrionalis]
MANYGIFGAAMFLAAMVVISVPRVDSYQLNGEPLLLEFGNFVAADRTCFLKKIFRGQKSPYTLNFNNPANTNIDYIKLESAMTNKKGSVNAEIIRGAVGTISVSLMVSEASGRSTFTNDVQVQMLCP